MSPEEAEVLEHFREQGYLHFRTGSREICDPPVLTTDADWVVLIEDDPLKVKVCALMMMTGLAAKSVKEGYEPDSANLCVGDVNVIVLSTKEQFAKWYVATAAAKQMNLLLRSDRVDLFNAVCRGDWGSVDLHGIIRLRSNVENLKNFT